MRKSAVRWALFVGTVAFAAAAMAADEAAAPYSTRDLEKYVGRALVKDGLAQAADVIPLLPQSCPPFYLRDEHNKIIDPTIEEDVNRPVSFRQTCGGPACHDVQASRRLHFQMRPNLYRRASGGTIRRQGRLFREMALVRAARAVADEFRRPGPD